MKRTLWVVEVSNGPDWTPWNSRHARTRTTGREWLAEVRRIYPLETFRLTKYNPEMGPTDWTT